MDADELRILFGIDYPAAALIDGNRIPLVRETAFSRWYYLSERNSGLLVSRFMDGSSSMTAAGLYRGWPSWTLEQRKDFCVSCVWLEKNADFADMIRFIMKNGSPDELKSIVQYVPAKLPRDEAYHLLVVALRGTDVGNRSGIFQALAETRYADTDNILRQNLQIIWDHPALWNNDEFDWAALDVTICIKCLIELGAPPGDFESKVRRLSQHGFPGNRDSCREFLSKHYSWLNV